MSPPNKAVVMVCLWLVATTVSGLATAQLSLVPSSPTPLDTVRLRWAHVGCTNPDSMRITMQANRITVQQSADKLFAMWNVYGASGRSTWYSLQPGSWKRDAANILRYVGIVYLTTGPDWRGAFDASAILISAVGTASFIPQGANRARFEYLISGVNGSKQLVRFAF